MDLILEARRALEGRIRRTPIEESPALSEAAGVPVSLKLECLQLTGSFKIRGAFFRLLSLSPQERRSGVATCSAGNHGKAVAHVARELGIPATIYVPRSVDESKYQGILARGAEVVRSEFDGFDETEALAREHATKTRRPYVSAYDEERILAANGGTLAAEVLEDAPSARSFLLPVGGAGLSGGFAYYAKASFRTRGSWAASLRPRRRSPSRSRRERPSRCLPSRRPPAASREASDVTGFERPQEPDRRGRAGSPKTISSTPCVSCSRKHQCLIEPSRGHGRGDPARARRRALVHAGGGGDLGATSRSRRSAGSWPCASCGQEEIRRAIRPLRVDRGDARGGHRAVPRRMRHAHADAPRLSAGGGGEVHIKSSYRGGGPHFALKIAGSYVDRPYGVILLVLDRDRRDAGRLRRRRLSDGPAHGGRVPRWSPASSGAPTPRSASSAPAVQARLQAGSTPRS